MSTPRLSIGLPVYNGEDYLEEAVESILQQTYTDFELVITDNASTDRTEEICRAFAARDSRVKYHRNPQNIGATPNWYRSFDLSCGEYFASAAHDDMYAPEYMQKCIAILDLDPSVVVCYTKTRIIDKEGNYLENERISNMLKVYVDTMSASPSTRFWYVTGIDYLCIQLYGVIRADVLRKIKVYSGYYGCDRNLLIELALRGKIYELPDYLFIHRVYEEALGNAKYSGRSLKELFLLDPATNWNNRFSAIQLFFNYLVSIAQARISFKEKLLCSLQLLRVIFQKLSHKIRRIVKR